MHEHATQLRQADRGPGRAVPSLVAQFSAGRLTWWPQLGIGHYPVEIPGPYDKEYFDRYARDAQTDLGRALMRARCEFVEQHFRGTLVDVGIGSGAFVTARRARKRTTYGWDVNPTAILWLDDQMLLVDPYLIAFDAMTLWDVLEHMADFQSLLANCREWLFLSLPIFRDAEHALRSKHFRPKEHYWYMTRDGLIFAMEVCGFALVSESAIETELGREDIGTFAFRKQLS